MMQNKPLLSTTTTTAGDGSDVLDLDETAEVILESKLVRDHTQVLLCPLPFPFRVFYDFSTTTRASIELGLLPYSSIAPSACPA